MARKLFFRNHHSVNPILSPISIRSDVDGPHLLVTAGVHGDEYEPITALRKLGRELSSEIRRGQVTLIPRANPSAYDRGQRRGEDDLDLARVCPGSQDGTITERAAYELSAHIRAADLLVDLHTGGQVLRLNPFAGYTLNRKPEILGQQRRMAQAFGLPLIWGTNPDFNGTTLAVARDADVPAIYVEWAGGGWCDPAGVNAMMAGVRNIMAAWKMTDQELPESAPPRVIEDPRDGSGVMQTQYPASVNGFFEPAVQLDQRVEVGDLLGHVFENDGDDPTPIRVHEAGFVLGLKSIPKVSVGDALVVVMTDPGKANGS
ncbi:MAG: putative deacylase [Limisphaerales bacterium]|jgi:predicted deacylase